MTDGNSLSTWFEHGMLDREMKIYELISKKVNKIQIFSYGTNKDKRYLKNVKNIVLLNWVFNRGMRYYARFGHYLHYRKLKQSQIFKTNQILGSLAAVKAKEIFNKPLIVRCGFLWSVFAKHGGDSSQILEKAECTEAIAFNAADKIIVTCDRDKETVVEKYFIDENKIHVIPNYVNIDIFKPIINIEKQNGSIIFVGRLVRQKNLFNLLESVEKVEQINELKIIGEGHLLEELISISKNMKTKVTFLGRLPNDKLSSVIQQSDIFILPSLYEGMPKTLLEAMSCGMPCIGANSEGIKEIIKNKENGILCEHDANSIADALLLLYNNEALRNKIKNNARVDIEKNYNLNKVVDLELNIYKELLTIS